LHDIFAPLLAYQLLDIEFVMIIQVDGSSARQKERKAIEGPRACLVTEQALSPQFGSLHGCSSTIRADSLVTSTSQHLAALSKSAGRVEEDSLGRMDEEPDELMRD
jgi:hypothetical protein